MINTTYLKEVRSMAEADFLKIAGESEQFALVNVVPVDGVSGWAIFGPYGVYTSSSGERTFKSLTAAHAKLAAWGIKKFFQVDQLKVY